MKSNKLIASVVLFGGIPNIFTIYWAITRYSEISSIFLISWVFGLIWVNIASYLVWYFDTQLMPLTVRKLSKHRQYDIDDKIVERIKEFRTLNIKRIAEWVLITSGMFIASIGVLESNGITDLPFKFFAYLYFISFGVIWSFFPQQTAILLIKDVLRSDLELNGLHPDKRGGLSILDRFIIKTSLIHSSGSIVLPFVYVLARDSFMAEYIFLVGLIYIAFITLDFFYPFILIRRRLREFKLGKLEELHKEATDELMKTDYRGDIEYISEKDLRKLQLVELRVQRLMDLIENHKSIQTFPPILYLLSRFLVTVAFPLIVTVVRVLYQ